MRYLIFNLFYKTAQNPARKKKKQKITKLFKVKKHEYPKEIYDYIAHNPLQNLTKKSIQFLLHIICLIKEFDLKLKPFKAFYHPT